MEQKTESKAAAHEGKEQKIGIVEKLKNIVNRDIWNETPTGKKYRDCHEPCCGL